ncbi:hypothetical protein COB21_05550 [Candidatus Aerophobetes bacterium]|uniref:Transmembrane protein n=1 Tax=Aerophobetes bacterium TaxID=2030807 RepID=A0A2A4WYX2_UNCAE|nr:MAG: hypothetical protein COB21_05550 [Candidatus Aerophobetes bacterium]
MTQQTLASLIFTTLYHTPLWVWLVFGYLFFIGIRALKPRVVYIPTLFIIPLVLSALKWKLFLENSPLIWVSYFACLAVSSFISFKCVGKQKIKLMPKPMSIQLPGTYSVLIIWMTFFAMKYFFGFLNATQHALYNNLAVLDIGINGVFSGYFLGKAIHYLNYNAKFKKNVKNK